MLKNLEKEYSKHQKTPLVEYALLTAVFNTFLFKMIAAYSKLGFNKVEDISLKKILFLGLSAHKLARVISKDAVTSFIRAPFTTYHDSLGYGEVNEVARGEGVRRVIGELLSCNYCMSAWVSLGLLWGSLRFPRQTSLLTCFFTIFAISDFLHVAYEESRTQVNVMTLREEKLDREQNQSA